MAPAPEPQVPGRAVPGRAQSGPAQSGRAQSGRAGPACYALRLDGHLDDRWSAWFGGLTLTQDADGTTSLTGPVADQAELHGLLAKVRDLGVTLISVALVVPEDARPHPHQGASSGPRLPPPPPIDPPSVTTR